MPAPGPKANLSHQSRFNSANSLASPTSPFSEAPAAPGMASGPLVASGLHMLLAKEMALAAVPAIRQSLRTLFSISFVCCQNLSRVRKVIALALDLFLPLSLRCFISGTPLYSKLLAYLISHNSNTSVLLFVTCRPPLESCKLVN